MGLSEENLVFEKYFSILLGKYQHEIGSAVERAKGWADILVTRNNQNMFIVETKSSDHEINVDDIDQAISYARLLGEIAPFAIVTNGDDTRIFDVISKVELNNEAIAESDYCKNGYRIYFNPSIRQEALLKLIQLNPNNLLNLCKYQVHDRITPLRSQGPSGTILLKKYIPELFVDRYSISRRVSEFLNDPNRKILLISGRSGVGKTNILCNVCENLLGSDRFVLFYCATLLPQDIETSMVEDFNWELKQNKTIIQYIQELHSILKKENKDLVICIDAIDEYPRDNAHIEINSFISKIKEEPIKVILTCKTGKLQKFLTPSPGIQGPIGESFYADEGNIESGSTIEGSSHLKDFDENELISAVIKYDEFFGLNVIPFDRRLNKLKNPLMLRIFFEGASSESEGQVKFTNFHEVCSKYVNKIVERSHDKFLSLNCLREIANIMLSKNIDIITEGDLDPLFNEQISFLADFNLLVISEDEHNRRRIFFNSDEIRKYVTLYHVLKLDTLDREELISIIEKNKDKIFFSELLIWYRKEEHNPGKKQLLDNNLLYHYSSLGSEIVRKYRDIVKVNFPFLEPSKGIVLFYNPATLEVYSYAFRELDEEDQSVVLETTTPLSIPDVFEKYGISTIHNTEANIFEDISYRELLSQYIDYEINNKVKRYELIENKSIGLLKERAFDILYSLHIGNAFPFDIFQALPISCVDLINSIDEIIYSGRPFSSSLHETRKYFTYIKDQETKMEHPLLPLGDNVMRGELNIAGRIIKDNIIYKHFFYTKRKLEEFLPEFFNNLFKEYKILIDRNFPNHKHNFKLYNYLPCYFRGQIERKPHAVVLKYVIFKNDANNFNEIELNLDGDNSVFNNRDFSVSTKYGLKKLKDWYVRSSTDLRVFFNPRGSYRLTNQILRNYLYYLIEKELKNNPIKL